MQQLKLFDAARRELWVCSHRLFQKLLQQDNLPAELPFSDSPGFTPGFADLDALLMRVEESGFFITLGFKREWLIDRTISGRRACTTDLRCR